MHLEESVVTRALIIVDVQKDFCEGGALPVAGGNAVAEAIAAHVAATHYDLVLATRDWHVAPGAHFSAEPDFVDSWPPHGIAGSPGAQLHPSIAALGLETYDKGAYEAAYSGFEAPGLPDRLRGAEVDDITVCGLATDYCVRKTAIDASRAGYRTHVIESLCAGVAPGSTQAALQQMRDHGIMIG